ncbi:MAG: HlyD family type I secretion periplasmic adaptor subunit [Alphaproteobacteria bacterium]|nr:HlyD family type I secretion periplasmic adaptor subunit [Alphaproteobacteria bacterium]
MRVKLSNKRLLVRLRRIERFLFPLIRHYSQTLCKRSINFYETKVPLRIKARIATMIENWQQGKLPSFFQKPDDETEFFPAALEIVEQPPSPASRTIAATIMLFFAISLIWACFGSVDIIATAQGKIIPTGRTKVIQPLEAGVVHSIHVQDGQTVKAGDVLIEIDSTITEAERDRLQKEYIQEALDAARLKAAINLIDDPATTFIPPEGATEAQVAEQRNLLTNQLQEIKAKLEGLDQQITQQQGNLASVSSTINKLTEAMPYLKERAESRKYLSDKGYGSKLDYLTTKQDLVEHQQEVEVQKGKLAEAMGAVASLQQQRKQAEAEYQHKNIGDLEEAQQKASSLHEQLLQATEKFRLQTLTSPVDGTVQQLSVHTEGGVVTPAEILMSIVPADSHMEIEAMVSNKDIGFVHAGQKAAIKVDTFNFTRYGLLNGKVLTVSQDAIVQDKPQNNAQNKQQPGAESETSEPKGQELIYMARVSLDQSQMQIDDRLVSLSPGMAVTVEIKTGSRHVISYLLSPIKKHVSQAMRER